MARSGKVPTSNAILAGFTAESEGIYPFRLYPQLWGSKELGPVALAFLGVSGQRDRARIDALPKEYGDGWILVWMKERKVEKSWIDYYEGVRQHEIQMAS